MQSSKGYSWQTFCFHTRNGERLEVTAHLAEQANPVPLAVPEAFPLELGRESPLPMVAGAGPGRLA